MIEVYRGSANTWECDEMGHMNVRFYIARMMEGLGEFAARAGMPYAFREKGQSTLRPREQHIRYMREALAGRPFAMKACVLEARETSVLVYQQIDHATGEPCAAIRSWVDHVDVETGQPFPWSAETLAAFETLMGEAPAETAPRSIDLSVTPCAAPLMLAADAISAPVIGRGMILPEQCDLLGAMKPEFFIGRISDSVGHLLRPWRDAMAADIKARSGGAVLEYRMVYRRWPRAGDRFVIRSSVAWTREKTHGLVHWIMDPDTGEAWCTSEGVAVALNLDARKIIPASIQMQDLLKSLAPAGLSV
jgi:acyl-CoA thioester hydrolase